MGAAYLVKLAEGLSIDAKAAVTLNIAGAQKQTIKKDHGISAKAAAAITAASLKMNGDEKITLTCGDASVTIDSSGIAIKGKKVTIEGTSELKIAPAAIKPGM